MNKKEISEIRKLFKKDKDAIDCICGYFVDNEKKIRMKEKKSFHLLSEEEIYKYYEIFKKALSGQLGKNLHSLDYSIEDELNGEGQKMLLALRDSKLQDEELLDAFCQKAVDHYEYGENYYVVLIHGNYDVPGRGTDGLEMEDASDTVYEYVICCICPVTLSRAGLCYNAVENCIEEREQKWWVEPPMTGFLFPAFNDRTSDVHSLLYYTGKPEQMHSEFLEGCIGGPVPMSFKTQRETFQDILSETLGEDSGYEVVKQVQEELSQVIEQHKEEPEPVSLNKPQVRQLLERSGVKEEKLQQFDKVYETAAGDKASFLASSVFASRKVKIETGAVRIQVDQDCMDLIRAQMIDGKQCLVIPIEENVEINGLKAAVYTEKN